MRGTRFLAAVGWLWLCAPVAGGGGGMPTAQAQASVSVTVVAARGVKGGNGATFDPQLAEHAATLSRVGGFGDWKASGGTKLDAPVGKTETRTVGEHALSVTLDSLDADKAKTTISVVDSAGKAHRVSASLSRGGSQILAVQAADGSAVVIYIVTIRY